MKKIVSFWVMIFVFIIITLSACGGGGGGGVSSSPPTQNQTQVGTAVNLSQLSIFTNGTATQGSQLFYNLTGSDTLTGEAWTYSYSEVSDGSTTFEGNNVRKFSSHSTYTRTIDLSSASSSATVYFLASNGNYYKRVNSSGVTTIPTTQSVLPTIARVGDTGSTRSYITSDNNTQSGIWRLDPEFNGNSKLTISQTLYNSSNVVISSQDDTYYLDNTGSIYKMTRSLTESSVHLVMSGNVTIMVTVAGSGLISLPKTGQTNIYATGDDGALQKGVAWPTPRFNDNNNGTVTDNLTGLVWLKNANCFSANFAGGDWADALSYVNGLANGSCGLTDNSIAGQWRLPNISELESLVNYGQPRTADWLNTQGFINAWNVGYWSSTSVANAPGNAWLIMNLSGAGGWATWPTSKTLLSFVMPVRTGQSGSIRLPKTGQTNIYATGDDGALQKGVAWPTPRFNDNNNGTVTDNLTGLVWLKNANCYRVNWTQALSYVNGLANGSCGLTDNSIAGQWRLPNANELQSLVNYGQANIAGWLNTQGFSNVSDTSYYWSSTTDALTTSNAWTVNMFDGSVSLSDLKLSIDYVLPVRAGH